jgi:hypothetical protein
VSLTTKTENALNANTTSHWSCLNAERTGSWAANTKPNPTPALNATHLSP